MPKVALLNQTGSQVGEIELAEAIFGIEPNDSVLYDAIVMQQASRRQGTHDTKGRSEVRGGGRKPWKQKGTGRARQGSLSSKVKNNEMIVLEGLAFDAPKTKDMVAVLLGLSVERKALVVTADYNETIALAARNIPGVTVIEAAGVNVLDLVANDKVIFTKDAVAKVEEVLA